MNILKKLICLSLCAILILGLSACNKKTDEPAPESVATPSNTPALTPFTIGNLTVKQIVDIYSSITLNDSLALSLVNDGLEAEYHFAEYEIVDASGKKLATVNMTSDLENKAQGVSITWDYKGNDEETNVKIVAAAKTLITAAWPDFVEDYTKGIEKFVRFETSYLNAFKDETRSYTANAQNGGYIAANMSGGIATYSISYPNVVENV